MSGGGRGAVGGEGFRSLLSRVLEWGEVGWTSWALAQVGWAHDLKVFYLFIYLFDAIK